MKHSHEFWMSQCFDLAKKGKGYTGLNPLVGAVIVHQNRIIGKGYHEVFGQAHAEVNAIRSVSSIDQKLLPFATIYVSLEPCTHFGKTPPCAHLIIENKIPKVVISSSDPNRAVEGNGIAYLKSKGVEVIVGILKEEGNNLIRPFIIQQKFNRPYIILKWAESKDGFVGKSDEQIWLSNQESKTRVHQWRAESDAILVGTNTAIIDNPRLNVRLVEGKNPIRIIIDRHERIPKTHHVISDNLNTVIFTNPGHYKTHKEAKKDIILLDPARDTLSQITNYLMMRNLGILFIEGGPKLLQQFIVHELWDEARVIRTKHLLNSGIQSPMLEGNSEYSFNIGTDLVEVYYKDQRTKS